MLFELPELVNPSDESEVEEYEESPCLCKDSEEDEVNEICYCMV